MLDGRTSEKCQEKDGEVFALKDAVVGVNMPPLHPWCRSLTEPVIDDEARAKQERWARDPVTSEQMKVPRDMTYKEWKEWQKAGAPDIEQWKTQASQRGVSGGDSGAKKTPGWEDRHAQRYYEEVRKRAAGVDAEKIAANTGFTKRAVEEIREHVFIQEHQLSDSLMRFAPDYEQAQAWQRLTEGRSIESDMVFLKHEYVELTQMRLHGYTYDEAHVIANKRYDWASLMKRKE